MEIRISTMTRVALAVVTTLAIASAAAALRERSEEGFPLTFEKPTIDLGDQLERGVELQVSFTVTNPTDAAVTYRVKSSSRQAHVTHKEIELAPGESGKIDVRLETPVAGPFRHRIGVVVDPTRAAVFLEGSVLE